MVISIALVFAAKSSQREQGYVIDVKIGNYAKGKINGRELLCGGNLLLNFPNVATGVACYPENVSPARMLKKRGKIFDYSQCSVHHHRAGKSCKTFTRMVEVVEEAQHNIN